MVQCSLLPSLILMAMNRPKKHNRKKKKKKKKKKDRGLPSLIESKSAVIPLQFHESGIFSKQVKGQIG